MKTAIKTTETNYARILDEMEDAFLDAPHPKSFTVPQGGFERPNIQNNSEDVGGYSIVEFAIAMFFSFAFGFWLGISHVQGVLKSNRLNMLIEQISFYLVIGIIPSAWIVLSYLYFKKRR